MTKEQIIEEIIRRKNFEAGEVEITRHDIRTPAFNQNLGRYDALGELLEWIEENAQ